MIKIKIHENGQFDITHDNQKIGHGNIIVAENENDFTYLESIEILPEYRNQGLGTKALYRLSEIYGEFYFAPDNEDAQRLYDRIADQISNFEYSKFGFAIDQGYGVYVL
jgi:ribosomal protein S18 acetylase RimI-like enzyme